MSKRILLEKANFHICNSGVNLSIVHEPFDDDKEEMAWSLYHLVAEIQAFGIPLSVTVPLGSPEMVWWLHHVTGKVLKRMMTSVGKGRHYHLDHPGRIVVEDGNEREFAFKYDGELREVTTHNHVQFSSEPGNQVKMAIGSAAAEMGDDESVEALKISLLAFGDEYRRQFVEAVTEEELRLARADLLGKQGSFTKIIRTLSSVPAHRKQEMGELINGVRGEVEMSFDARLREIHGLCK